MDTYFLDYRESVDGDVSGRVHFARIEQAELEGAVTTARLLIEEIAEYCDCRVCVTVYDAMVNLVARLWSAFDVDATRS